MIIGYLAQKLPQLTLTFVYREIAALRAAGLRIETFSIWKPSVDELSDEAKALVKETFYVFPLDGLKFLMNHAWYLCTRPRRYLNTLWFCLSREHKTLKNRLRTLNHFAQAVHMAREVERKRVTHLHAHFALNAATIALVISRLTDVTFSFTAHANDIFVNPILLAEKIESARFIVAISEFNARFLHEIVPGPDAAEKLRVVHCGIDVGHFSPAAQPVREMPLMILGVGRLVEKKGFFHLIAACKILTDRGYEFQCLIIGDGPQHDRLQRMIDESGLSHRVRLVGSVFQEQLKDYLIRADVFVLPCVVASDRDMDGIPNTLMEAMAMEIPAISTIVSGIPELIEDGKTGLLVPPADPELLAQAIANLLDHPELRLALGKAGRAKVKAEFEITKSADALLNIFKMYFDPGPVKVVGDAGRATVTLP